MALVHERTAGRNSGAAGGLAGRLAEAVLRYERALTQRLVQIVEAEGAGVDDWRVLRLLAEGDGRTMSELAAAAAVPGPSLTRLVDRLVADNLLHRRADEADRRRIRVHLTERGRALHRRLDDGIERDAAILLAGATIADTERLIELLTRPA